MSICDMSSSGRIIKLKPEVTYKNSSAFSALDAAEAATSLLLLLLAPTALGAEEIVAKVDATVSDEP